jgi:Ca2+/Na+ antiporter
LGGLTVVAVAAGCLLTVLAHDLRASFDGVLLLIVAVVAAVGLVVARRQPSNPIGWLLLAAGAFFAVYAVAVLYTVLDYHRHGGRLPLGRVALAGEPSWVLGVMLLGLAVALFPDGRLASRRWRIPLIVYVGAGAWFCGVWSLSQATLHIGAGFDVDGVGNYVGSQGGFPGTAAAMAWAASPIVFLLLIAFVMRQAATWRRATGERRKQLTWLMSGGAVSVVSTAIVVNTYVSTAQRAASDVTAIGLTAIPLAIGVGILKYRLYEIDRLISRTLSYLAITGLLAVVFLGLVALTTSVLPFSSPVGVAASTLAAAALFTPLRRRVQRLVDRRFNRARYDADSIVAAFTIRLRDAVDLDTISQELRHAVNQAVAPAHASVWITPTATPRRT